jgi:hypothetical protein
VIARIVSAHYQGKHLEKSDFGAVIAGVWDEKAELEKEYRD